MPLDNVTLYDYHGVVDIFTKDLLLQYFTATMDINEAIKLVDTLYRFKNFPGYFSGYRLED